MAGTARNFLFALNDEDVALSRLLLTARSVTGFMDGAPGAALPGWHAVGADNRALLETLYARLEATYPHAGQPFYAVRLWTNLMWQPAYLAVIAVHVHGAVPDLRALSQAVKGIDVNGFRLPPGLQFTGDLETMLARTGAELRSIADGVLAEINGVTKLKRIPALRLLADRMLGLMVRLRHYVPGLAPDEQKRVSDLWLAAMGLTGQGDLEAITLGDGTRVMVTARKGCCLDYLAFPDTYCASCPKQDDALRRKRQWEEAEAERSAAL
ncbi:hypothetical protein VW35_14505 [Devosia soli]|uniref:Ferric siderophore reductase C-terminal domain-containing protein n=1 Tax=Devosia soli TaxID=361041 RepID=A0A0F5L6M2_9HYPH|nr:siderophore ferric iron reductase [Devosia soli]KKB77854.1 hypothetical protein VW35_14505 [Devosia soli]